MVVTEVSPSLLDEAGTPFGDLVYSCTMMRILDLDLAYGLDSHSSYTHINVDRGNILG